MVGVVMFFVILLVLSGLFMLAEVIGINKYYSLYLAFIPSLLLFIILAFNRMSRDYLSYELMFSNYDFRQSLEKGYAFFVEMIAKYGGDHSILVFLTACLFMILLYKLAGSSGYLNLVIFFYSSYVLIYDITQTRNFLMYIIVMFSLILLKERKVFKHYLVLYLSTLFHKLGFIYFPFYFLCKIKKKNFEKFMIIVSLLIFIFSSQVLQGIGLFIPNKVSYFYRTPGLGVYINYASVIVDLLTIWWIYKKTNLKKNDELTWIDILYRFCWLSIFVIPFSSYFLEVIRIQRNTLLAKYVFVALSMKYLKLKDRLIVIVILVLTLLMYLFFISYSNQWDLYNYIDTNYILDYLKNQY